MSKYQPLSDHLAARTGAEWPASFAEVEAVLGFPLPKAARTGRAWWADDLVKPQGRAWTTRGWTVAEVDPSAGRVVFRRAAQAADAPQLPAAVEPGVAEAPRPAAPKGALIAAGLALVVGLGALTARALTRRR
jgi:hypothetical protein